MNATRLIRILKVIVVCALAFIVHKTIQTALGNAQGLGDYFLLTLLSAIGLVLVYFVYGCFAKSKDLTKI